MTAFPILMTPELMASVRGQLHLRRHTWYIIAATVLCILNRPEEISRVYKYALEHGSGYTDELPSHEEQLFISRRMREALIKAASVGGMPKTINAMVQMKTVTPECLTDAPWGSSATSRVGDIYNVSSLQILQRGQSFFHKIYGKVAHRVMTQMNECGTGDLSLAARLVYGYFLSNTDVLDAAETSFVLISGLIPQDVNMQLKGHLKGALNGGATVEEVMAVRGVAIRICEAAGMRVLSEDSPCGWGWRSEVVGL